MPKPPSNPPLTLNDIKKLMEELMEAKLAAAAAQKAVGGATSRVEEVSNICRAAWKDGKCTRKSLAKGLCWTHYQRGLRAKAEGRSVEEAVNSPIRPRGSAAEKLVMVQRTAVPKEVAEHIKRCATANGKSEYEFLKELLINWYRAQSTMGFVKGGSGSEDSEGDTSSRHAH